jgi:hypothetical protein
MKDYNGGFSARTPMIEYCVLFENTKYPKIIGKSVLTKFLRDPVIIATALDQMILRDGLGPLEEHVPLERKYYNTRSRKYDPRVHGKYALPPHLEDQPQESQTKDQAQGPQTEMLSNKIDQISVAMMALQKQMKIMQEQLE